MSPLYTVFRPHDIDTTYLEYFSSAAIGILLWISMVIPAQGLTGSRLETMCFSNAYTYTRYRWAEKNWRATNLPWQPYHPSSTTAIFAVTSGYFSDCPTDTPFYTFSWEQRKLASLCEKFTDGDWIESKDQSDFGVRLVQTGNVGVAEYLDKTNNKKWISEDTFDRLHCEEVLPGDILISRLPEPAGRACIVPLLGTKMITAVDCTIVRTAPDMSNKFLVQYLSSQAYFDDVNTCLAGGTRQRISRGNLANFNVPIPVKSLSRMQSGCSLAISTTLSPFISDRQLYMR